MRHGCRYIRWRGSALDFADKVSFYFIHDEIEIRERKGKISGKREEMVDTISVSEASLQATLIPGNQAI